MSKLYIVEGIDKVKSLINVTKLYRCDIGVKINEKPAKASLESSKFARKIFNSCVGPVAVSAYPRCSPVPVHGNDIPVYSLYVAFERDEDEMLFVLNGEINTQATTTILEKGHKFKVFLP